MIDYLCLTTARIDIASAEIDMASAWINSIAATRINDIAT